MRDESPTPRPELELPEHWALHPDEDIWVLRYEHPLAWPEHPRILLVTSVDGETAFLPFVSLPVNGQQSDSEPCQVYRDHREAIAAVRERIDPILAGRQVQRHDLGPCRAGRPIVGLTYSDRPDVVVLLVGGEWQLTSWAGWYRDLTPATRAESALHGRWP